METDQGQDVIVSGALLRAFVNAGESLRLLLWGAADGEAKFDIDDWYPLSKFRALLMLTGRYSNSERILEQIGAEMSRCWYHQGPGREIISSSIGFLRYQTGSGAYQSVIRGPVDILGEFSLAGIDETAGVAHVRSSTVFPRAMERGILYGGLGLIGDLLYFDVVAGSDPDILEMFFVTPSNRTTVSWHAGPELEPLEWRMKHLEVETAKKEQFWHAINDTLNDAFAEIRDALENVKTLRGLLPICSACKKIRDDKGYWTQLEDYIKTHSEADFTHGLCPSCAQKLYPGFVQG